MKWCVLLLLFFFGLSIPPFVRAQSSTPPAHSAGTTLSFSEIFACQVSGTENDKEWIEFYNDADTGTTPIDLANWIIEKKSETSDWSTKTLSGSIPGKSYVRFEFSSSTLSDGGFAVRLKEKNDPDNVVYDLFPQSQDTFEKCLTAVPLSSWVKQGNTWSLTTILTPNAQNTITAPPTPTPSPSPTPTVSPTPRPSASPTSTPTSAPTSTPSPTQGTQPTNISLSEVYACQASGAKEWVELFNGGSSQAQLNNWKLLDTDGNSQTIASLTINAKEYAVVEITKYAQGMFTNTGDSVKLVNGANSTVDEMSYTSCSPETSSARVDSEWVDGIPSKGQKNPSVLEKTPQPTEIPATEDTNVLGTTIDDGYATAKPSVVPSPVDAGSASNVLAYASLGTGALMLSGVSGYMGYDWWIKHKKGKH